jgi:putative peptidoglycan lipid II flippase
MEQSVTDKPLRAPVMHRVVSFASITAAGFVLGRLSGLLREMVVSAHFGLSAELDAYFLAYLVPTLINNIVAGSAITAAVMPTFAGYLAADRRAEFWRVASVITSGVLFITGALTVLGMLLADPIIGLIGAGAPPYTRQLADDLLLIMMPTLILSAALNMLMAMLNAADRFIGPALIFLALNLGIIVTVIILSPVIGVSAVAWGFLIGVALQVAIQIYELRYEHPQLTFALDFRHPALRQVALAFLPITALAIIAQINLVVDRAMAGTLRPGSISALAYADTILGSFYMVGISLGIAVFPSLSRMAAVNDLESTARTVVSSLRLLIFVLVPITFLVAPFAPSIIGLVLGRGKFDASAVGMTAQALVPYGVGLVAVAMLYVLQRAFYALGKNALLLGVGAATAVLHVVLNVLLMRDWAHAGIALSTSLTAIVQAIVLIFLLRRQLREIHLGSLVWFMLQCAALSAIGVALVTLPREAWGLGSGTLAANVVGVALAVLGGLIYWVLALIARVPESQMLVNMLRQVIKRQ